MKKKKSGASLLRLIKQKERKEQRLLNLYELEEDMLSGKAVQSYSLGSRSVSRYGMTLTEVQNQIEKLEEEIALLETEMAGGSKRKTVAAVPRDW